MVKRSIRPPTEHIDATEKSYDCWPYYNYTDFEDVNDVAQYNPVHRHVKDDGFTPQGFRFRGGKTS